MLKGKLRETLYEMPTAPGEALDVRRTSVYGKDEVTYISDDVSASLPLNLIPLTQ